MKLYQKMLANLSLRACEVIDFEVLPVYRAKRDELFSSLGMSDTDVTEDPGEPVVEELLPSDPLTQALEALNESLSLTVWIKRDGDPFSSTEFIIGGMAVQEDEGGAQQFLVLLKARFTEAQHPIPLHMLLTQFQPLEALKPQDYHS